MLDDNAILDATAADPPQASPLVAAQAQAPDPAVVGQWGPLQNWPIEWINAIMLPTGKVLGYDRTLDLRLWDPVTNTFSTPASPGYNFFCTGDALLSDGTVLMTGGAVVDTVGLPFAAIYNPFTDSWTQLGNMNAGRWYPSTTTLANGDALVLSGDTNGNVTDPLPQVYDSTTGTWRDLTGAVQSLPFYPRTFSAPNGDAFVAGPQQLTEYIDTSGIGQIIPVADRIEPDRNFGSAVMYAPGKILYVGGGSPAVASAEVIDLNQPNPTWREVSPMAFARRNCNATLLPDGEVLVVGGNTGSSTYDGDDVMAAEIWNPKTEQFTTLSDMSDIRWYHSTALLLPDGRVLSTSGDLHLTGQVFSPPYLFQGTQPTISSAPGTVEYGDNIFVGTPDAAAITNVSWVRLGSATHAQNWDQYYQSATFTVSADGTGLNVDAPPTADSAPPGYYYLFIDKGNVPSVAKIIKVGTTLPELSVADTSVTEGATGHTVNAVFTVSLSLASAKTVTVAYATANDTALAGQNYTAKTGILTFAPLVTSQTITVPILADGTVDPNESFMLNLSAPVAATLLKGQAQGLIRDFNSAPVLQIKGATVTKADAATTNASFVVTLSTPPTTQPVTVAYTTVDGTATAPHDYIAQSGTLTFNPGVTQQTIVVGVAGNTTDEYNDTFMVKLLAPVGATLDVAQAQGLIYNQAPPAIANLPLNATIDEPLNGASANLVLTATLSAPSGKTIVLPWTTAGDGTAVPNVNFVAQLGKVTFLPGTTTATLTIAILDDGVKEPSEGFSVQMQSELQNANYGNRYTFCFINDSDTLPAISLSNASVVEGAAGTTPEIFTATLTAPMAQPVTVAYQTSAGTATANVDYTQAAGVITFAAGATTQLITVLVKGDLAKESNETFNLTLGNAVGAMLDIDKAVGTIVDDDGAPVLPPPTNLTGVPGFGLVALSWQATPGATSYSIYRGTNDSGEGTLPIATGIVGTAFTDTGLTNNTVYYYRVTAVNGPLAGASYEGSASGEFAIAPTSYDFSNGFIGSSNDPTVQASAYLPDSFAVLSLNGLNVEDVRSFGAGLQLTDGGTNQTDSAYTLNPVNVTRFFTQFTFQQAPSLLYTDALADGMTFTIQGAGPTALGVSGGGLGYAGIGNSVAVKFDLFNNSGEGADSTGLYTNGATPGAINSIDLTPTGIDLHSAHPFHVGMTYDGTTLQVTITDTVTQATATQSYTVNIPAIVGGNTAYVGFTAGTGGLTAMQTIQTWAFTPAPVAPANLIATSTSTPVSLSWTNTDPNATAVIIERKTGAAGAYAQIGSTISPTADTYLDVTAVAGTTYFYRVRAVNIGSTSLTSNEISVTATAGPAINFPNGFAGAAGLFAFNGTSAKIVGTSLLLTDGGVTEAASIFALAPINVTHFTTQFSVQSLGGTNPTADGMTFTIQGVGSAALGGSGGALGYAGIGNSLAVKFDLFDNAGEGPDSTGLYTNGAEPNAVNSINLTGTGVDLHSGHVLNVGMTYDGVTLVVTITDSVTLAHVTQSYTVNIPAIVGANAAYVGFTGGTGGLTAVQNVLNWTYAVPPTVGAPANLLVTAASNTQVSLSWTNTDPAATGVLVERKTGAGGTYAQIGMTANGAANTYTDLTVVAGTTYFYRVRATNSGTNSTYSNEIHATATTMTPVLSFPNGFAGDAGQFSFNGPTPKIVGTSLQVTDGGVTEGASIFALTPVNVAAFSTQFDLQILSGTTPTADGMTFTIQGVSPAALGGSGGSLGFAGIPNSLAIKFDVFDNAGEGPNSTGLFTNGTQPNAIGSIDLTGTGIDLHSGDVFNVSMTYDGVTLLVTITDTVTQAQATQSYTVNIPAIVGANAAYVGFTGGTGGLTAVQNVLHWTYAAGPAADLQITNSDAQTTAVPGAPLTYTIVVTNAGPSNVTGAGVADALPAVLTGATFTATATGGATGFTLTGNGSINDSVNLPAGSTITYLVHATLSPAANAPLSNTATVNAPAGVTDTNAANNTATDTDTLAAPPAATIRGRYLFYNNSKYDGNTPGAVASDDNAIATDKVSYLPGSGPATFANLSSYSRGINGIMIDISGSHPNIGASDFEFKVGNNNSPSTWISAPNPIGITVRAGAGTSGSDRIELIWADGAIQQQWLEVTALVTPNTGLAGNDVFFFGNEIGDTGVSNTATIAKVTSLDLNDVQSHGAGLKANIPDTNLYDFNRDGQVNSGDITIAQSHATSNKTGLPLINIAAAGPFAPDPSAPASEVDGGVATSLAVASMSPTPTVPAVPAWIANRLTNIDSNDGPVAKYLEQLAREDTAQSVQILAEADQVADSLGLDDHVLDSLLVDLGLG